MSEALATRVCDIDLDASELPIATLKRRRAHWRAVPVPEAPWYVLELSTASDTRRGPVWNNIKSVRGPTRFLSRPAPSPNDLHRGR